MARWVKVLAAKLEDLSLIAGTNMVGGKTDSCKLSSTFILHMLSTHMLGTHMLGTHMYTSKEIEEKNIFFSIHHTKNNGSYWW